MGQKYVLDTNVILLNPHAIYTFGDADVVVPIAVIEELDRFKKDMDQIGRHAREFSRILDDMRRQGSLHDGVHIDAEKNLGKLYVLLPSEESIKQLPVALRGDLADNYILATAMELNRKGDDVVFITQDTNLRIKADACGIPSMECETGKVDIDELYSGAIEVFTNETVINTFYREGKIGIDALDLDNPPYDNQFFMLQNSANPANTALGRYSKAFREVRKIFSDFGDEGVWGLQPRNREQRYAFDLLLDESIKLVTLVGIAGTGKTLLAIAAGLLKVADENKYKKLLVSRPVFPMGKDLGYLPGSLKEKLHPWMAPIYDNVDFLIGSPESSINRRGYEELLEQNVMEIEALTYIRGRSLPFQYLIVDEAQNLTPHEIKTIITRAGQGTKVVFTGDPYQIDNPYVDSSSNGLSYIVERFKGQSIAGHVTLRKGERSELAELAANIL